MKSLQESHPSSEYDIVRVDVAAPVASRWCVEILNIYLHDYSIEKLWLNPFKDFPRLHIEYDVNETISSYILQLCVQDSLSYIKLCKLRIALLLSNHPKRWSRWLVNSLGANTSSPSLKMSFLVSILFVKLVWIICNEYLQHQYRSAHLYWLQDHCDDLRRTIGEANVLSKIARALSAVLWWENWFLDLIKSMMAI